jgi:hypothetical protein
MRFNQIDQSALRLDPSVDKVGAELPEILNLMSQMELRTLAFMGLKYSIGYPVKMPNGIFPYVLHLPDGPINITTQSNMTKIITYPVAIAVLVGVVGDDLVQLTAEATKWILPFIYAYGCNTRLGGRVGNVIINAVEWGKVPFAKNDYFGPIFHSVVTTYRMVPHDPPS